MSERKPYTPPTVLTLSSSEVLSLLGPVQGYGHEGPMGAISPRGGPGTLRRM
jgi:hypothetical protein